MVLDPKEAELLLSPQGDQLLFISDLLFYSSLVKDSWGEGWILLVHLWVLKSNRKKDFWDLGFFPWPW